MNTSRSDFGQLKDRLTTVFLILPGGTELDNHGVWLRVCVVSALNALYRRGAEGMSCLMMLSEFAQLGKVAPIRAAFGQARKYKIRCWPVLQNWSQLIDIYGPHGAWTFIANSGCVMGFNPGNDTETAEFFSTLSDEHGEINVSASPDPLAPGDVRININEQREPVWTPGETRQLPDFHGLVFKSGFSQPQPVCCAPYWTSRACRRVARPDPYHLDGRRMTLRRKLFAGALGLAGMMIPTAWLFVSVAPTPSFNAGPGRGWFA